MERHYGMDWLRIGAFALLILYHVGMVFVPWGFHIKAPQTSEAVTIPMMGANAWRLTLLFVVSGFASRAILLRAPGLGGFVRSRSARLLVPLLFGVVVIVPPQSWVEFVTQHGYTGGFLDFWLHDYFRFAAVGGVILPTYNHLWFVAYLWAYTLALALLLAVVPGRRWQAWFDRAFAGTRVLWLPVAYLVLSDVVIFGRVVDTHDIIHDMPAHFAYVPALLFGFGLAGSPSTMRALADRWHRAGVAALLSYAAIVALMLRYPALSFPSREVATAFQLLREVQCWSVIAALIGAATRFLNRDHPWRATLAEAVFPFYIIHQTALVLIAYWLRPLGLGNWALFALLVAGTAASCWAFYALGREVGWLRPLIGLKARVASRAASAREPATT